MTVPGALLAALLEPFAAATSAPAPAAVPHAPSASPRPAESRRAAPPAPDLKREVSGRVVCAGSCPAGPVWVLAYGKTDRYGWPWWDAYGILGGFHTPAELDALRPAPVARVRLDRPGPFRLPLPPAQSDVFLFALLDASGHGPARGPAPPDWIARFPRNPAAAGAVSVDLILQPLVTDRDYARLTYAAPAPPPAMPRFTDATAASGIAFRHCQGGDLGHLPNVVGSGALLEDLDGDGDLDLVAVQGRGECAGAPATMRLYANDGRGRFTDATTGSGLEVALTGMGIVAADYDHDGDFDLYVTCLDGGRLFRNDGGLRFTDVTAAAGVGDGGEWAAGATFGDVDGDGLLDLYVANYVAFSGAPPFTPDAEVPTFVTPMLSSPFAFPAVPHRLFLNRGDGTFAEAPDARGAADPAGKGMAAVLADLDHDGDLDLYVTNDCSKDALFENRGGRFVDVRRAAGVDDVQSGMGIALGDVDGDGLPDLFSPHWMNEPVVLYANASRAGGRLALADRTVDAGLGGAGNGLTGWSSVFLDADLDGDLDLFVTNGHTHPGRDPSRLQPQPLQLFVNDGHGRFADASAASGAALLDPRVWRGAAVGDVDGDGVLDAYVVAWNDTGRLLRGATGAPGPRHWLAVRLARANGERGGVGARVELWPAGAGGVPARMQTREVVTGTGYLSHSPLEARFGLGTAARVRRLEVVWPGGRRERFPPPSRVDRVVELVEGRGLPPHPACWPGGDPGLGP